MSLTKHLDLVDVGWDDAELVQHVVLAERVRARALTGATKGSLPGLPLRRKSRHGSHKQSVARKPIDPGDSLMHQGYILIDPDHFLDDLAIRSIASTMSLNDPIDLVGLIGN